MNNIDDLKNIFKNHIPKSIQQLKKVAVLIAVMDIRGMPHIIFQRRSNKVNQAGDISFIGGHIENGEEPCDAVIREAMEECNLSRENIEIFGESDYLFNFSGLFIHVFVGKIVKMAFEDIKANEEVERMYAIPLEKILSSSYTVYKTNLDINRPEYFPYELIANGQKYNFFKVPYLTYFYEFEECIVWGLTANILNSFVNIIKEHNHI